MTKHEIVLMHTLFLQPSEESRAVATDQLNSFSLNITCSNTDLLLYYNHLQ